MVGVEGPGFSRAFRIDVHEPGENWDVELGARLGRAVNRGEVAFITFQARAIRAAGDTGEAYFSVYAQKASPNWDKSLHEGLAVGADWQAFTLPFSWGAAYAATQASFVFGVGGVLAGHRDRRHPGDRLRAGRHPRHAAGGAVHLRRARPPTIPGAPKPPPGSTRSGRAIS